MALKAKKDGIAIDRIGETDIPRQIFAGQTVPGHWQYEDGDVEQVDDGQSVVYAEPPYVNPARGNLTAEDPDSSHARIAADREAAEQAAKSASSGRRGNKGASE